MKKFLLSLFALLIMINYSSADIVITVYGAGGIVAQPDGTNKVCPNEDDKKCADITVVDPNPGKANLEMQKEYTGKMNFQGRIYDVQVLNLVNDGSKHVKMQGATVKIK